MNEWEQEHARRNRKRVELGYCNEFYDHQRQICTGWELSTPAPPDLVLGELPRIIVSDRIEKFRIEMPT